MSRTDTIKTERRRRKSASLAGYRQRLGISGELDPNFSYRWVNDDGVRVHRLTHDDDYEVVQDRAGSLRPDGIGMGSEPAIPVGHSADGKPLRAVLLRKPKALAEEDAREHQAMIDETEAQIAQNNVPGVSSEGQYTPRTPTSIRHGS